MSVRVVSGSRGSALLVVSLLLGCGDVAPDGLSVEGVSLARGGNGGGGGGGGRPPPTQPPQAGCAQGATRAVACGLNGRGQQAQTCERGSWLDTGTCADPDVCVDGATELLACGLNLAGSEPRICVAGQWQSAGACDDPDECVNGATQTIACGLNGRGTQPQLCSAGAWSDAGACVDPDECVDDTSCDDADACTVGDFCQAGRCISNSALTCADDGDPCTTSSCDSALGCVSESAPEGTSCVLDNADAACGAGTCQVVSCFEGFDDCDGELWNGCEVDLTTDPDHCGSCGAICGSAPSVTSENPSGAWSFGKVPAPDGAFTPLDNYVPNSGGLVAWYNAGDFPAVLRNPNAYELHPWGTTTYLPGTIALHPAANGSYAVLRWTARTAGRYAIGARFTGLSGHNGAPATTTDVGIVRRGAWLGASSLNLDGGGNAASFAKTVVLDVGESIDFVVGNGNGTHYWDSTGVEAAVVLECVGLDCPLACAPSTGDCDGDPGNGCETDTASDTDDCGGCGIVCTGPEGAAVSCDEGRCSYTQSAAALPTISVPGGEMIVWPDGTIRAFGGATSADISPDGATVVTSGGHVAPAIWVGDDAHPPLVTDGYQDRWASYQDGTIARQLMGIGCCNIFRQAFAIDPARGLGYSNALSAVDLRTGVTVAQVGAVPGHMSMSETVGYATLWDLNAGSVAVYGVGPPSGLEWPAYVNVDAPSALRRGAVDWDDALLVTSTSGRLARVLPDATVEYSIAIGATTAPVFGGASAVLVGTESGTVEARSSYENAAVLWSAPVGGAPSRIVAGSEGMTYVLVPAIRALVVVETDTGVVLYRVTDLPADASEMIIEDGVLLIGTVRANGNVVMRLPVGSAGYDPASPWPVVYHDNQRTAFRHPVP